MRRAISVVNAGTYPAVQILSFNMRFLLVIALALTALDAADALQASGAGPQGLQRRYVELKPELGNNAFGRPLHLDSTEGDDRVAGDVHAVVERGFASAAPALAQPENWCDILLLVFNIKQCRNSSSGLEVSIGRKGDESIERASVLAFSYRVASKSSEYLQVRLAAAEGPMNTKDYTILLEAVPLAEGKTFIHLSYAYGFGTAGRLAMKTYLATVGSRKVGFSTEVAAGESAPKYVGGMRGVIERNTMRYYLAIESFLGALDNPRRQRFEIASRDWFASTERYARQLREMDEAEYLAMKRKEFARQTQVAANGERR
jgi:hypothetical protein